MAEGHREDTAVRENKFDISLPAQHLVSLHLLLGTDVQCCRWQFEQQPSPSLHPYLAICSILES